MIGLLYCLFAGLSGFVEAVLYAQGAAESFGFNEHAAMFMQRLAVWLLIPVSILTYNFFDGNWYLIGASMVGIVLCFPAAHDECYNFTRLWLNKRGIYMANAGTWIRYENVTDWGAFLAAKKEYTYGYQSASTTARNDFNGTKRTLFLLAGLLIGAGILVYHFFYGTT